MRRFRISGKDDQATPDKAKVDKPARSRTDCLLEAAGTPRLIQSSGNSV